MKEHEQIEIICPQCNTKICNCDGRSKINKLVKCKSCKKMVLYNVSTKQAELTDIPSRTTAAGMTFY